MLVCSAVTDINQVIILLSVNKRYLLFFDAPVVFILPFSLMLDFFVNRNITTPPPPFLLRLVYYDSSESMCFRFLLCPSMPSVMVCTRCLLTPSLNLKAINYFVHYLEVKCADSCQHSCTASCHRKHDLNDGRTATSRSGEAYEAYLAYHPNDSFSFLNSLSDLQCPWPRQNRLIASDGFDFEC